MAALDVASVKRFNKFVAVMISEVIVKKNQLLLNCYGGLFSTAMTAKRGAWSYRDASLQRNLIEIAPSRALLSCHAQVFGFEQRRQRQIKSSIENSSIF